MKKTLEERLKSTKKCQECGRELSLKGLSFFSDKIICERCKINEHDDPGWKSQAAFWLSEGRKKETTKDARDR